LAMASKSLPSRMKLIIIVEVSKNTPAPGNTLGAKVTMVL
jgi:hypothetical protein